MTGFEAFILGLVQGLTEFLPVSSSGHLVVFQTLFGIEGEGGLVFVRIPPLRIHVFFSGSHMLSVSQLCENTWMPAPKQFI